jgi:hypothetical protein
MCVLNTPQKFATSSVDAFNERHKMCNAQCAYQVQLRTWIIPNMYIKQSMHQCMDNVQ